MYDTKLKVKVRETIVNLGKMRNMLDQSGSKDPTRVRHEAAS